MFGLKAAVNTADTLKVKKEDKMKINESLEFGWTSKDNRKVVVDKELDRVTDDRLIWLTRPNLF